MELEIEFSNFLPFPLAESLLPAPIQVKPMKSSRKLKIAIVLSISVLINVFLIWEVFRLRAENSLLHQERSER
ncbi:MAG: hypothetical protein CMI29_02155 [Opitutae bacterium]|nr:hypothetical protein [Opitutae bacterium]